MLTGISQTSGTVATGVRFADIRRLLELPVATVQSRDT